MLAVGSAVKLLMVTPASAVSTRATYGMAQGTVHPILRLGHEQEVDETTNIIELIRNDLSVHISPLFERELQQARLSVSLDGAQHGYWFCRGIGYTMFTWSYLLVTQ